MGKRIPYWAQRAFVGGAGIALLLGMLWWANPEVATMLAGVMVMVLAICLIAFAVVGWR